MKSDISFWGVALLFVLFVLSVMIYKVIDRREMVRVLKTFGLMAGQTVLIGAGIWVAYKLDSWWANLLWLLVMVALATGWCLYTMRSQRKQLLLPVIAALTVGLSVRLVCDSCVGCAHCQSGNVSIGNAADLSAQFDAYRGSQTVYAG